MLRFLLCSLLLAAGHLHAQPQVTTLDPDGATTLHLSANFSNVHLTTGSGTQITVEHSVTIDGIARPELAELDVTRDAGILTLTETGPTLEQLEPGGKRKSTVDDDRHIEISLIVRIPRWLAVTIETIYGSVEVSDAPSLRKVDATYGTVTVAYSDTAAPPEVDLYSNYGSVDLTLPASADAQLELTTEFGELLTDFDIAIDEGRSERREFFERVVGTIGATSGGGAQVQCRAPYGKVYLRQGL